MSAYTNVQLQRTNYGVLNYCRLNLNQAAISGTWYDLNRQQYLLNPTTSADDVAIKLPSITPFKTSKYDISAGMPSLTATAKRNKFFITSYLSATRVYTLSGNIDWSYIYPSLQTRVHYYSLFRDVTISSVNTAAKTFKTTTEAWQKDLFTNQFNITACYLLDEPLVVSKATAGNWKLFPYTKLIPVPSEDQDVIFKKIINTTPLLPPRDNTNSTVSAYTVPFALQFEANTYTDRYFLSTAPGEQRDSQTNLSGRFVYGKSSNFTEYTLNTVPLTTQLVSLCAFTNLVDIIDLSKPLLVPKLKFNNSYFFLPKTNKSVNAIYIGCTRYTDVSGLKITQPYSEYIFPLSGTSTNIRMVSSIQTPVAVPPVDFYLRNNFTWPPKSWGVYYDASDSFLITSITEPSSGSFDGYQTVYNPDGEEENILISSIPVYIPGNELHLYKFASNNTSPRYQDILPMSIITPATGIQGMIQTGVSGYGTNLVLDSRYKKKNSTDAVTHNYVATVSGKKINVIEAATLSSDLSSYNRDFFVLDFNYPHLSANSLSANKIEKMALMLDSSDTKDKYTVLAVHRPGVTYKGETGIVEIYAKTANTPLKLFDVLTIKNSSLSAVYDAKFCTAISAELGTLCVAVTSTNGAQVEVYDFSTQVTITTAIALTALDGTKSTYEFSLSTIRRNAVTNTTDNSFGKCIYYDDALGYDPFFENQILTTNRLYVASNSKLYIYEEFNNQFIPLYNFDFSATGVAAYYNNFVALSTIITPQNTASKSTAFFYNLSTVQL